jgi:hypothetical protein
MLKFGFKELNKNFILSIFQMLNVMYQEFILLVNVALDALNLQLHQLKGIIMNNKIHNYR